MTVPVISPVPPAPVRNDAPSDYTTKADTFAAALPVLAEEINAAAGFVDQRAAAANGSAQAAGGSATAAAQRAAEAASNAGQSANAASNAANSAAAAASEAAAAASIKAEIRNRYYGPLASDPSARPDGSARIAGDEYYNSVTRKRRVYNGAAWEDFIGASTADLADDSDALRGAGMTGFSHAVNYPAGTLGAHARRFVSVKDKPFNAVGNGVADDAAAIEAAFASGAAEIAFPAGNYLIGRNVTRPANVIVVMEPGATITGAQLLSSGVALNQAIPTRRMFGKLEIRDRQVTVSHTDGFETDPHMGQLLRLDAQAEPGQCAVYLSGDQREPVIGSTHYVGLHSRHNNTAECPNLWGYNPVVVKNIRTTDSPTGKAGVLGVEISLSNNTDEAGTPLVSGELGGLFISYIHAYNRASAALSTGGYSAGFNHLLWLDGVAPDGTHIALRDEVSANAGAKLGIDTSGVSQFTEAALLLGNNHRLAGKRSDTGDIVSIAKINTANQLAIGDASHEVRLLGHTTVETGRLELGTGTATQSHIDFHSSGNGTDYDARLYVTGGNASDGNAHLRIIAAQAAFTGSIRHYTDNTHPFGGPSNRATEVYAANNTINTSDEREKSVPIEISDELLDAWAQVKYVQFKWLDAVEKKGFEGARWHFGVIAQRVKEMFEAAGLDPFAYGVLCRDEWDEQEEIVETWDDEYANVIVEPAEYEYIPATEESRAWRRTIQEAVVEQRLVRPAGSMVVQPYRAAGYRFGIRYEQALVLEAALMRRATQRLDARLAALELATS